MARSTHQSVLLIGASRGLGLAIAEEYLARGATVVATVRGERRTPLHDLSAGAEGRLEIEQVDITEASEVDSLRDLLTGRSFDLLFVVAGTTNRRDETPADTGNDEFARVMITNALGPLRTVETLADLVTPEGTIAVMSSGQGSVSGNETGDFEIYRASKSALNQLMRSYAVRRDDSRTLLLVAPGWVRTELGGPDARLEVSESVPSLVSVVDAQHQHGGLQYLDYQGRPVAW